MDTGVTTLECTSFFTAFICGEQNISLEKSISVIRRVHVFIYLSKHFVCLLFFFTEQLKEMGFSERNRFLSDRWKELPEEERREYNKRALSEEVIANKELIKRAIKNIKREVKYSPLFIVQVTTVSYWER